MLVPLSPVHGNLLLLICKLMYELICKSISKNQEYNKWILVASNELNYKSYKIWKKCAFVLTKLSLLLKAENVHVHELIILKDHEKNWHEKKKKIVILSASSYFFSEFEDMFALLITIFCSSLVLMIIIACGCKQAHKEGNNRQHIETCIVVYLFLWLNFL